MIKRTVDVMLASFGLLVSLPILVPVMFLVWLQDRDSPFYIADRVGKSGRIFKMVKLRSMVKKADKSGVDSTSASDARITPVGHFIRRYKLDELTQLWNVLLGEMSLVGPRPNVKRETDLYTKVERQLLSVRPGITDVASIVFADESEVLRDSADPDLDYNQLIRPWKSRLGILYVENQTVRLDVMLILVTVGAIFSRRWALDEVTKLLTSLGADDGLIEVARRQKPLIPTPPPGTHEVVRSRYTVVSPRFHSGKRD